MPLNSHSKSHWKIGVGLCAAMLGLILLAADFNGLPPSVMNPQPVHAVATAKSGNPPTVCAAAKPGNPTPISPATAAKDWRTSQEDNICEAVFRSEINLRPYLIHYLSIRGKDPSPAFMQRFGNLPVHPESQTKTLTLPQIWSGKQDRYFVTHIRWITDMKVDVEGGAIPIGGRAGGGGVYHLKFLGGHWMEVGYTVRFII